jgi:dTDP-4-dehydrorhamnose reductase
LRVLVTGAGGLVGRAVSDYCASIGDTVLPFDHKSLDITDRKLVSETLVAQHPDAVINCAAWTNVDACESDQEKAFAANARGPENLAAAALETNSAFVTISTDYVFDGNKEGFYTQDDKPNPESVYAASKLAGEDGALKANPNSVVVRTGYVFGPRGNNFLSTIIERARRGEKLKAINDTYGTPTYSKDLAVRLRELAALNVPGIYHVVNSGPGVSFEEFARAALEVDGLSNVEIEAVSMESLDRPAKRPRNSRLRCLRSEAQGLAPLRGWRDALVDFVSQH